MLLLNDNLFPRWEPFEPVRKLLSEVGLTDDEVGLFEAPFKEFRHQESGKPLDLPEDVRTSDEWFDLLFRSVLNETTRTEDEDGNIIEEYGKPNRGLFGQINLDNIGRDFLCLIYYRQRVLDLFRTGGLNLVVSDLFKPRPDDPFEYANLTNSLIPVEALTDFLIIRGTDIRSDRNGGPMVLLTDPPTRHLTLREIPSFSSMLNDSSNLSRYIRTLSVILQDGGKGDDLNRVSPQDFDLDDRFTMFDDRRRFYQTRRFCRYISMTREFCLWDIYREDRLPSIRQISDGLGISYSELLRILLFGDNNSLGVHTQGGGCHRFVGLLLIRDGFSDRLVQIFVRNISSTLLTSDTKSDIL